MSAQKEVRSTNKKTCHLREYIYCHEQSVHRNMNVEGVSCEDSEGNEEHFILKLSKHDSCCIGGK